MAKFLSLTALLIILSFDLFIKQANAKATISVKEEAKRSCYYDFDCGSYTFYRCYCGMALC